MPATIQENYLLGAQQKGIVLKGKRLVVFPFLVTLIATSTLQGASHNPCRKTIAQYGYLTHSSFIKGARRERRERKLSHQGKWDEEPYTDQLTEIDEFAQFALEVMDVHKRFAPPYALFGRRANRLIRMASTRYLMWIKQRLNPTMRDLFEYLRSIEIENSPTASPAAITSLANSILAWGAYLGKDPRIQIPVDLETVEATITLNTNIHLITNADKKALGHFIDDSLLVLRAIAFDERQKGFSLHRFQTELVELFVQLLDIYERAVTEENSIEQTRLYDTLRFKIDELLITEHTLGLTVYQRDLLIVATFRALSRLRELDIVPKHWHELRSFLGGAVTQQFRHVLREQLRYAEDDVPAYDRSIVEKYVVTHLEKEGWQVETSGRKEIHALLQIPTGTPTAGIYASRESQSLIAASAKGLLYAPDGITIRHHLMQIERSLSYLKLRLGASTPQVRLELWTESREGVRYRARIARDFYSDPRDGQLFHYNGNAVLIHGIPVYLRSFLVQEEEKADELRTQQQWLASPYLVWDDLTEYEPQPYESDFPTLPAPE